MEDQSRTTITTGMVLGNRYQIVRLIGEVAWRWCI